MSLQARQIPDSNPELQIYSRLPLSHHIPQFDRYRVLFNCTQVPYLPFSRSLRSCCSSSVLPQMTDPSRKEVIWLTWSRGPSAQSRRGPHVQVTQGKYLRYAIFFPGGKIRPKLYAKLNELNPWKNKLSFFRTVSKVHAICTCSVVHFYSRYQRGLTYIESDRITTSAPMESADQAAWAGGRVSTTWLY